MDTRFFPNSEDLRRTDFRNPSIEKSNVKQIILLVLCIAMFAVVFIPWFCIGVGADEVGSIKLRAFGFQTWYGIVGAILALVAVAGVVYKHLSLSLCCSVAALLIGIFALNVYPTSRLVVNLDDKVEDAMHAEFGDIEDLYVYMDEEEVIAAQAAMMLTDGPRFKVPGALVGAVAMVVETVDQRAVYKMVEEATGVEIKDYVDIINHRLGAILYLIFAAGAAALSYISIVGCGRNRVQY